MPSSMQKAILQTIIYADIFDYPLTRDEIGKWLIKVKSEKLKVKSEIKKLKITKEKDGYYYLKNRKSIVAERKERENYSQKKLKLAQEITNLLKLIPTIKLVGITGTLAVLNSKEEDDIDLFIITSPGLLWTTRLLVTILVEITGRRRHPMERKVNNKICLNMFVDEGHMEIPHKEQDLFSAHEVVQMKLLWDKDNTYKKFLGANYWVKKYLPNTLNSKKAVKIPRGWQAELVEAMTPPMVEELAKRFQLWYMRKRRTTEVIKDGIIRFHPQDARIWILKKYRERIKRFR